MVEDYLQFFVVLWWWGNVVKYIYVALVLCYSRSPGADRYLTLLCCYYVLCTSIHFQEGAFGVAAAMILQLLSDLSLAPAPLTQETSRRPG